MQGFILKGEKALMMPVVPRDSARRTHSEDGEVPSTASSDRHSSRDRSVACQILIKRTAAERGTARTGKVSVQRGRQPPREQLLKIINQQDWKTSLCCSLLAAPPPPPGRGGRALQAGSFLPRRQPPSSSSSAGLWQYPTGHRLPEPILTLSLLPPKPGLGLETSGRLTCW